MSTRPRSHIGIAAIALTLVAVGCSSAKTSLSVGRSTVVTVDNRLSRTHEAPSLLVDRKDPDTVYLAEVELQAGEARFYVSSDRGASWKQSEAPRLAPYTDAGLGAGNPKNIRIELHQDSKGTIYYLFHAQDPTAGGARSVLLGRSSDGGLTWKTSAVHAAPKATETEAELNWQAHIAIDPANEQRIYAVWRRAFQVPPDAPARPVRPFMAVSTDGGATFGPPVLMMDKGTGFEAPRLIVRDGKLFAFYRENPPAAGPGVPEPRLTTIVASVSEDQGKTWKDTVITAQRDASEPVSIYDEKRKAFYVVWHDNRNQDLDIFFSKSADGVRWSEPRQLNDDPKGTRVGQFYPKISLVPGARIDVAWYDFRNDSFPAPTVSPTATAPFLGLTTNIGKFDAVYMTSSEDGGDTWSKNIRISDVPNDRTIGTGGINFQVQVPLAVASTSERTILAWSDTRYGNADSSTQDIATNVVDWDVTAPGGYQSRDVVFGVLAGFVFGAGLMMWGAIVRRRRATPAPAETAAPVPGPAAAHQ
ncbi:MAG: glycoside hydrolase [Actinomycetota bacterium]|nr:glycoside hydrolase [Actinomycetota bacterium]